MGIRFPARMRRAIARWAWLGVIGAGGIPAGAADIELNAVPVSLEMLEQRFLWNEASSLAGARVHQVPVKGQAVLDADDVEQINDGDPCSGATLSAKGEFCFLVKLNKMVRVRQFTVTGILQGTTATVQITNDGIGPSEAGWITVGRDQPMHSPCTSVLFRPQPILQALVTIRTNAAEEGLAPSVNDIAIFSERDVREFELTSKSRAPSGPAPFDYSFGSYSDLRNQESIFNLSGMYADARVAYISAAITPENINAINDGNPDTTCTFDPQQPELLVIMDLSKPRRLHKISLVHGQQPGTLTCFAANQLPWDDPAPRKVTRLAWLPISAGFAADFPLLAQLGTPAPAPAHSMQISASLFNHASRMGSVRTDASPFTQLNTPPGQETRFLIIHHATDGGGGDRGGIGSGGGIGGGGLGGFRINDMGTTGNCSPADFMVVPRQLPQLPSDPIIRMPPPAVATDRAEVDPTKLGEIGVVKAPPPASPSAP